MLRDLGLTLIVGLLLVTPLAGASPDGRRITLTAPYATSGASESCVEPCGDSWANADHVSGEFGARVIMSVGDNAHTQDVHVAGAYTLQKPATEVRVTASVTASTHMYLAHRVDWVRVGLELTVQGGPCVGPLIIDDQIIFHTDGPQDYGVSNIRYHLSGGTSDGTHLDCLRKAGTFSAAVAGFIEAWGSEELAGPAIPVGSGSDTRIDAVLDKIVVEVR